MSSCGHNSCMQRGYGCNLEGSAGDIITNRVIYLQQENASLKAELERLKGKTGCCTQCEQYARELEKYKADGERMAEAAEMLWVVLANVSDGNWIKQSFLWTKSAARWRDEYFKALDSHKKLIKGKSNPKKETFL